MSSVSGVDFGALVDRAIKNRKLKRARAHPDEERILDEQNKRRQSAEAEARRVTRPLIVSLSTYDQQRGGKGIVVDFIEYEEDVCGRSTATLFLSSPLIRSGFEHVSEIRVLSKDNGQGFRAASISVYDYIRSEPEFADVLAKADLSSEGHIPHKLYSDLAKAMAPRVG